jgi:RNA polymerase sigma factor (sigma-70 family)
MTTAAPDWDLASDAELACGATAGDRRAFAGIYDRYANRLHDFCIGMVRDRDAAADCVQDVFCTAAAQLPKLRDPDKLRPWLYAIAKNEALRCVRERRRERVSDELPEAPSDEPGPDTLAARSELADLIAEAADGLSDRDRAVLELAYRHSLDGPELADALGVSAGNANRMVSRLRDTIETSLGALLVARRARNTGGGCAELRAILAGWDGRFSVLMRKRIARHIESCPSCEEERRKLVSPVALLGGVPVFIPAPDWLRNQTLNRIQLTSAATPIGDAAEIDTDAAEPPDARDTLDGSHLKIDTDAAEPPDARDTPDGSHPHLSGRRIAAVVAATLLLSMGLTLAWLYHQKASITPTEVTATTTAPAPAVPSATGSTSNGAPVPPQVSTNTATPATTAPATQGPSPITTTAPASTQCPNGTGVPAGQSCPPVTVHCPDGTTMPAGQGCPSQVPVRCPNGSSVPAGQSCPAVTVRCPDGTTMPAGQGCPSQVPVRCPNGSSVSAGQSCPAVTAHCPDGTSVTPPQTCPPLRPVSCPKGQTLSPGGTCVGITQSWRPSQSPPA